MSGATVSITSGFSSGSGHAGVHQPERDHRQLRRAHRRADAERQRHDGRVPDRACARSSSRPATARSSPGGADGLFRGHRLGRARPARARRAPSTSREANQPPVAVNQSYGAVGNTPLGVGTSPQSPAATQSGSVLNGDSDPDSGDPVTRYRELPAGARKRVDESGRHLHVHADRRVHAAPTPSPTRSPTATIPTTRRPPRPRSRSRSGRWSGTSMTQRPPPATGQSTAPFNTLAAANSAAGASSIVFLYQGSATYTGGVSMKSGEDLFGQPHGLTVDGYSLVVRLAGPRPPSPTPAETESTWPRTPTSRA